MARVPGCDLDTLPCWNACPEHAARDIMADLAGPSTNAGARRFLERWDRRFHSLQSRVARYGLAIVSVTVALGLSLALQYYQFRGVEVPVLTLATWYAGNGPAVVTIILSSLCFDYFFTEPYYSLEITSRPCGTRRLMQGSQRILHASAVDTLVLETGDDLRPTGTVGE